MITQIHTPSTTRPATRGCLALNASYEPLEMMPVSRAIRLVLENRAEIVEADPRRAIRSASRHVAYPVVIRLARYVRVPRKLRRGVSNTLLFARDGYTCAYCGRHRSELRQREFLTRDHVVPQCEFGDRNAANTWENCVTSCNTCNHAKGSLPLAKSGLTLRITPAAPHFVRLEWKVRSLTPMQEKYVRMFFGDDVAESLR